MAAGRPLPEPLYRQQFSVSARPRPLGFSDTLLLDPTEGVLVPHRQLTFRVVPAGQGPRWVTRRRSLVETDELLAATMSSMLALLLAGVVGLHRYLSARLWIPFRHTLAALRAYDLPQHRPLALPVPAIEEYAELNQALTHFSRRLVADYESLREFTANAAHETQTPLAIMQAQLEQLLQVPAWPPLPRRPAAGQPLRGHAPALAPASGAGPAQPHRKRPVQPGRAPWPR